MTEDEDLLEKVLEIIREEGMKHAEPDIEAAIENIERQVMKLKTDSKQKNGDSDE